MVMSSLPTTISCIKKGEALHSKEKEYYFRSTDLEILWGQVSGVHKILVIKGEWCLTEKGNKISIDF